MRWQLKPKLHAPRAHNRWSAHVPETEVLAHILHDMLRYSFLAPNFAFAKQLAFLNRGQNARFTHTFVDEDSMRWLKGTPCFRSQRVLRRRRKPHRDEEAVRLRDEGCASQAGV